MERKTAHDFDQEVLILFDAYVHGALDRRGFIDKASRYAVGGVTAAMMLDQLSPKFAEAQVVKPEDERIKAQYVVKTGHASDAITAVAEKGRFDLLMMGSHGHTALGKLVLGSVATKVMAHSDVPVLLIR